MNKKSKLALGIGLPCAALIASIGVGVSAWVAIDIDEKSESLNQVLYTVELYNDASLVKTYSGLERDSSFELPSLADSDNKRFSYWHEQDKTQKYTGTVSLSEFTPADKTVKLYAAWGTIPQIKVTYESQTYTVNLTLQDPYIFPLFNLNPNFNVTGKTLTGYTYLKEIAYKKRTASGYTDATGSSFGINDALVLASSIFPELSSETPVIQLTAVYS